MKQSNLKRPSSDRARTFAYSLRTWLVGLMTLALLPLGLISVSHTRDLIEEAQDLREETLVLETAQYAKQTRTFLGEALGAADALGTAVGNGQTTVDQCRTIMRRFVSRSADFIFAGYIPADSVMRCASNGPDEVDFSQSEGIKRYTQNPTRRISISQAGRVSKQPVLIISDPIETDGAYGGFVSLSLPLLRGEEVFAPQVDLPEFTLTAILPNDQILSSGKTYEEATQILPADMESSRFLEGEDRAFVGPGVDGTMRLYSLSVMVPGTFSVLGSTRLAPNDPLLGGWSSYRGMSFPILMWLAGLGVVGYGVHRMVFRHIRDLSDAMRRFASGERKNKGLELSDASAEFQDVAESFNRMAVTLTQAEARAQQDLQDKELLLREVHHRVKNNLQFVASIINMQSRRIQTKEGREILQGLQRRVRGLATMHKSIYGTAEMTDLNAADLLQNMVDDMMRIVGQGSVGPQIKTDLQDANIIPDQAAPLSLLFAEVLTNAIKHSAGSVSKDPIGVSLSSDGQTAILSVTNAMGSVLEDNRDAQSQGIGVRLVQGFVEQLNGVATAKATQDIYCYEVAFPILANDIRPADQTPSQAAA